MKAKVISLDNAPAGDIELSDTVFGVEVRKDLLARMVQYQLAKRRAGTHKVKSRGEVAGGGAKPFRQKGTGRARQGTSRAAQMRGGGIVHGPSPRSYAHSLTKKVRAAAMRSALSAKQADGKLVIVDGLEVSDPKTKALAGKFAALGWNNVLIVGGAELNEGFAKAARNLPEVDVLPTQGANVYDILRRDMLVLSREAAESLQQRLGGVQ